MITVKDIYYLAGLWDGEGTFFVTNNYSHSNKKWYKRIQATIKMTDKEPLERTKEILNSKNNITFEKRDAPRKDAYIFSLSGKNAAALMMMLYTLLCPRRQLKIKECLEVFKEMPGNNRDEVSGRYA